ncbi:MAG: DNA-binding response regulator [Gammaproteobacteria bacterium HGW-Gammaproteobacteria-3]|nr:MAG: DNA-binding response regulator [Gammaproteobacteria bacterium HGW-Gammaproteobacteria-3]
MLILLVEDDRALAEGLKTALKREGFTLNHVVNGKLAIEAIKTATPDIVVLDLGLPDIDGLEVLKNVRSMAEVLPVLILTARDTLEDKVTGLNSGADDYLLKPFEIPELLARLHVLERRLGTTNTAAICIGDIALDITRHEVFLADQPVELPRKEYMLLKALMENAGRIQTRERLLSKLYSWGEETASNSLEVHIHHLRKKLGSGFIKTVHGVGYLVKKP